VTHLSEDDLVLHYYREDGGAAAGHLSGCAACAAAFAALAADLDAVTPEPEPDRADTFGAEMWRRVEAQLPRRTVRWEPWLGGLALAASLVLAFWLGRQSNGPAPAPQAPMPAPTQEQVRERVLLVAVGDHLERSQMLLLEVVNAPSDAEGLAGSQRSAEELAAANRLYRQAAVHANEPAVASVLDELERVLVEIAHSPQPASSDEIARLRQRIESKGLLLKVRVVGSQVREKRREQQKEVARGTRT
jgi:hypothetical protein